MGFFLKCTEIFYFCYMPRFELLDVYQDSLNWCLACSFEVSKMKTTIVDTKKTYSTVTVQILPRIGIEFLNVTTPISVPDQFINTWGQTFNRRHFCPRTLVIWISNVFLREDHIAILQRGQSISIKFFLNVLYIPLFNS